MKRSTLIATLVVSLSLTLPATAQQRDAKAAAKVKEVIGHMGSCADRPPNTLAGIRRAIEAGAHVAEIDARTTKDGALVCIHDEDVDRTTDGKGKVATLTLAELKRLDAGSKFAAKFANERVPTLREVLALSKTKIAVMIDLKESGDDYIKKIAAEVREHGEPKRTVLGVRSIEHAKQFRTLLPEARQIGLIPTTNDIKPFADAGVKVIRLWPRWLTDKTLVPQVRKLGLELHIGTGMGTRDEVLPLLVHEPESLSSDDPAQLIKTLGDIVAGEESKPNIVVIMADDLGFGDVGWHGGPYKTPHLDKLAQAGVRLEQHYSLPVCSPTRSSLLSGRFNSRFGCTNPTNDRVFPFDTVTLAAALKSVGYETGLFGKWHLGSKVEWGPHKYGFDVSYGSLAGGVTAYSHVYKTGEFAKTWHRNGKLIEEEGHVTDLITREAVAFVEKKRSGPFFLYVPYTAVHLPIDEPKEWLDLYAGEKDFAVRQYGACVSHLDAGVGKIVDALQRTGQRDNTIVLFLSDNGGSTGTQNFDPKYAGEHPKFQIPAVNRPFRGKKATVYEGGIRTPAILSWPGKLKPRDEQTPIHVADWFPTFAAVVGFQSKTDLKWDGGNLWPVLTGEKKADSRTLYWVGPGGNSTALRHGNLILIRQKDKPDELYDLAADPGQKNDLAAKQPETVRDLTKRLSQIAERDNDAKVKSK